MYSAVRRYKIRELLKPELQKKGANKYVSGRIEDKTYTLGKNNITIEGTYGSHLKLSYEGIDKLMKDLRELEKIIKERNEDYKEA